jgi:hypothetical protein
MRATTLLQNAFRSEVCSQSYGAPKSRESLLVQFWDSHSGVLGEKSHLDVGSVASHIVYYKGKWCFPQVRAMVSLVCPCCSCPHSGSTLVLEQATGNTDSLDSPWPGLRGSHHLPPYSILCVCPRHLHPNGFLSRDSQGGVPKSSQFGLPGLWELITPSSKLRLG